MKIAVIAGTPIDTNMGAEFLKTHGWETIECPISQTPDEQSILQVLYPDKLKDIVSDKIREIKKQDISNIFVYCNSLTSAVDMDKLSFQFNINIVTPHQVYREMGKDFKVIGVLAANNQSTYGIEKVIQKSNPNCHVIGVGILPLVNAIESGINPEEIVEKYTLDKLIDFFNSFNCEAIILGCTHFPYFYKQLQEKSAVPVIDPALKMLEKIVI